MGNEVGADLGSYGCFLFQMRAQPNSQFENPLELFCIIVPAVIVAQGMSRKVIVQGMHSTGAVSKNVICFPIGPFNFTAANMAPPVSFTQYRCPLSAGERNSFWTFGSTIGNSLSTRFMKFLQMG